jgi:ribosomal protein L16 Arg81 hydroxylase
LAASVNNRDGVSIRWLLAPIEPVEFFRDYWEKQPLVVLRDAVAYYQSLLTLNDVDRILASSSIRPPEISLAKNGKNIPFSVLHTNDLITQPVMHDALFEQYREGATLILQFLHERWQPLAHLSASVANELSAAVQANVYVTPKNAQGFANHYDDHDVFVLQVAGQKYWQIDDEPTVYLPKHENREKVVIRKDGARRRKCVLRQGDCAYIPRGWAHEAVSTDTSSIHITLGVNSLTWADMLRRAVETACTEDALRESLPPGFATDQPRRADAEQKLTEHLRRFVASLDPACLVKEAALIARRAGETASIGRLSDFDLADFISDSTKLRRRLNVDYQLDHNDAHSKLYFHGKLVTFPAHIAPVLDFVASAEKFTPAELPGDLDHNGRMAFVARLIEEGFLQVIEQ